MPGSLRSDSTALPAAHSSQPRAVGRRFAGRVGIWAPALVTMGLIFYMSHQPSLGEPHWFSNLLRRLLEGAWLLDQLEPALPFLDESIAWVAHFVEYGVLALCLVWALGSQWPDLGRTWAWAWVLTVLYGVTDEFHQSFVPGRYPDIRDLLTDAIGAACALLLFYGALAILRRSKRHGTQTSADQRS